MESKYTKEDLKIMQGWSLDRKIQVTQTRIMEWYMKWDNQVCVNFSGGKDSTVLADLTARVCAMLNCKLILWFSDTGLEYPELRQHVKAFPQYLENKYGINVELIMDYPKDRKGNRITFRDVLLTKGYPIISKEVARDVGIVKNKPDGKTRQKFIKGSDYHKKYGDAWLKDKWFFLVDAPFKISNQCCNVMKKTPAIKFQKQYGLKPIIGTMACESRQRKSNWLKTGCNAFEQNHPTSQPLSFWVEQDILLYIKKNNLPYPSVYGDIIEDKNGKLKTTGCERTGCMFCGFGCHLEKEPNRFQRLKQTHPKVWEYCMKPVEDGGLGMKDVLDYINVKSE